MTDVLYTIETGTSAQTVQKMIRVLFPDVVTVLDMTYGSGKFWDGKPDALRLTRMDADPKRGMDYVGDFTSLPYADGSFDLCVFDPPYQTDRGRGKSSVMAERFGHYPTIPDLREAIEAGCREAWRVSRVGVLVKIQDYKHASRLVRLSRWVEEALTPAEVYEIVHGVSPSKIMDTKWREQLSAYTNHTTYLAFRKDGPIHKRRELVRTCRKCLTPKPPSEFRRPGKIARRLATCYPCELATQRARSRDPDVSTVRKAQQRAYNGTTKAIAGRQRYTADHAEELRVAHAAHERVQRALKSGRLVRPENCQDCGSADGIEAAHADYSKPLDLRWLCRTCHRRWDKETPKLKRLAGSIRSKTTTEPPAEIAATTKPPARVMGRIR